MEKVSANIDKKSTIRSILLLFYLVVIIVFSTVMAQGFDLFFDNIKSAKFWGEVLVNLAFVIIVFNICQNMIMQTVKRNRASKYSETLERFSVCVLYIRNNNLFALLDKAIEKYNNELKQQAYDRALLTITDRVRYIDLPYDADKNEKRLSEKTLARLIKLQELYNDGALQYRKAKPEYIMQDKTVTERVFAKSDLSYNQAVLQVVSNAIVMISFLGLNILLNIIFFKFGSEGLAQTILSQALMFLSAVVSAYWYTSLIISATTASYEDKINWCKRYIFEGTIKYEKDN